MTSMTSTRPASHARLKGFSSRSAKAREDRASAQSRIAASTPKTTYGKHKNKLLPLTGSQFLRSDARDVINDSKRMAAGNSNTHRLQQQPSDSDDSPLSGAEPSEDIESSRRDKIPNKRVAIVTTKSATRPHQPAAADSPGLTSESEPEETRPAARSAARPIKQPSRKRGSQKTHRLSPRAKNASKLKPTSIVRGRLPIKELVFVPGTDKEDRFAQAPRTTNGMLPRDPISSSARRLLDVVSSDDSDTTPAKRKARAPLSTIRKRLRTPSSGHKSLQRLRSKMKAGQLTPTGSQLQQAIGDGFEDSELSFPHTPLFATKQVRKQREPLLAGLQALTLASGPRPEVDFVPISQLQFKDHQASNQDASMLETPAVHTASVNTHMAHLPLTDRCVNFKGSQDRIISAQLASVSAPRRERSLSTESEDDDGNDGGDEDNDDEAADAYLDEDERPAEDLQPALSEDEDDIYDSSPRAFSEPQTPGSNASLFLRDGSLSGRRYKTNSGSRRQRSCASGLFQRTVSGRSYLNELNEPIDDDFRVNEMLLGDIEGRDKTIDHSDPIDVVRSRLAEVARSSNQGCPPKQIQFGTASIIQPRSILKNSAPYISSDSNRPESTAANTRRNSTVDVGESRYFTAAKDQLDSTPTKPVIIRKKSGSRFYAPVEVPYSDDMVPETAPEQPDYTNTSQLHTLRRNTEALWISSAAPAPQKDLRSLTRSVSRDNGTLSQSVRRRSSLHFQSPMVGR